MNDLIPPQALKEALKQYRKDVPSVGTVSFEESQDLLKKGMICRGWTIMGDERQYFHIIRSPQNYPEKTCLMGRNEKELFTTTIFLGMQSDIDFDLLVRPDEDG